MENNKKECQREDVKKQENTNLPVTSDKEKENEVKEKKKVNFHSDYINKVVGDLDITV